MAATVHILFIALVVLPSVAHSAEVTCPPDRRPADFDQLSSDGCIGKLGWLPHAYLSSAAGVRLSELEAKLGRFWCEHGGGYVTQRAAHCAIRLRFDRAKRLEKISWEYFAD